MNHGSDDDTDGDEPLVPDLDPAVADRVRRDLADLGADGASAPEVPPEVTARVIAGLRAQPTHAARRAPLRRTQVLGVVVGGIAAVAGTIVGASMLARDPAPRDSVGPTAERITVPGPAAAIPLPQDQIAGLLTRPADYGPLSDPQRRASCLDGLGYPVGTQALGARPLDMHGRPAVLILLPGDTSEVVEVLAVEPGCSAAHTGLLASTVLPRP